MKLQIRTRNQITLPEAVLKELGLSIGDDLLLEIRDGAMTLIPAVTIPRDERYLFTPQWQLELRQAEKEFREGDFEESETVAGMFKRLEED